MVIGLTGQMLSGKDTVGAYLVEQYDFERKAFADKLKLAVANLFDIPIEWIDRLKFESYIEVYSTSIGEESGHTYRNREVSASFRSFLQRFGTEMARETFWYDFWVDLLWKEIDSNKDYVITDVRFKNEALSIKQTGGYIIQLLRPETDKEPNHASEQQLPYELIDLTITNDDSIFDLYKKVDASLYSLGVIT
jgi:hypothetical protein